MSRVLLVLLARLRSKHGEPDMRHFAHRHRDIMRVMVKGTLEQQTEALHRLCSSPFTPTFGERKLMTMLEDIVLGELVLATSAPATLDAREPAAQRGELDDACTPHEHAGMTAKAHQYTIRNVPRRVHRALSKKAAERGVSLNTLLVQALEAEAGERGEPRAHDDLDDLFGTWVHDKAVDKALAEQRKVDPRDWA